jgi:hypothetical protein
LETRCLELERGLRAKDDQLRELHESIQRTVRELERKERQVEEESLHSSALAQKLEESAREAAAANQRAQDLETEVRRLEKFRDERERRRQERPENSPELGEFDRAVRDVNAGRGRSGDDPRVPITEANLLSDTGPVGDYRDLPTLAALRNRLYDHKESQRDGVLSPGVPSGTARRVAAARQRAANEGSASASVSSSVETPKQPQERRPNKRPQEKVEKLWR